MPTRDLYEVLEVDRKASSSDLKKAYYRLAKKYHPDHNPGDKAAEEKFKEASNAYAVLSDDEQRRRYDCLGLDDFRANNPANHASVDDILSRFSDLFSDFFGDRAGGRRQPRGADLRVDLDLTFAEAVWGATKEVRTPRDVACATCSGSGAKPGSRAENCQACQGKGQVAHAQGFFVVQTTCPQCRGLGRRLEALCKTCQGRGTKAETSTLEVAVPPGVAGGQTLRLPGKGEVVPGGTPGHLFVLLRVRDDPRFRRDGADVLTEVPISFTTAVLGGRVEICALENNCTGSTTVELPPGTQPDEVMTLRGHGIPRVNQGGRGDHVLRFKVKIPKKLTARQRALMRELAAAFDATSQDKES